MKTHAVAKRQTRPLTLPSEKANLGRPAFAFSTALGWMILTWHGHQLTRLSFGHTNLTATIKAITTLFADGKFDLIQDADLPKWIAKLVTRLKAFAAGAGDAFQDVPLEVSHLTEFQSRVVKYCRQIPAGETKSYAQLAELAGSPRAARAVGNVMRSNRYPLIIPCHRVIGADGRLCGFTSPQGISMKERLLQRERNSAQE